MSNPESNHESFAAYRADIEAVEHRVAREIDPGGRALAVAILVFVLLVSFLLPHTGHVKGWDVLVAGGGADDAAVTLPSRLFMWMALVFCVGCSLLALLTRRWAVAWVALSGSAVTCVVGLLAVWSRQTVTAGHPGPGAGLILGWLTVIVLTFQWSRVVWSRTAVQLAAEAHRRDNAAAHQSRSLLDDLDDPDEPGDPAGPTGPGEPPPP